MTNWANAASHHALLHFSSLFERDIIADRVAKNRDGANRLCPRFDQLMRAVERLLTYIGTKSTTATAWTESRGDRCPASPSHFTPSVQLWLHSTFVAEDLGLDSLHHVPRTSLSFYAAPVVRATTATTLLGLPESATTGEVSGLSMSGRYQPGGSPEESCRREHREKPEEHAKEGLSSASCLNTSSVHANVVTNTTE